MVKCPKCGELNSPDVINCVRCHINLVFAREHPNEMTQEQLEAEKQARLDALKARAQEILVTTTPNVQNHIIGRYLGIVSKVVVMGTGPVSELAASFSDLFGTRSGAFQDKLSKARETALWELQVEAAYRGADAIVGVDLGYMTFTNNLLMVSASGTAVTFLE